MDCNVGVAPNEIENTVMCSSQTMVFQDAVGACGKCAISEIEKFDRLKESGLSF